MSSGIFRLRGDQLVEMRQQPYHSEDVLQALLEKYPNLLAGEQMSGAPLRPATTAPRPSASMKTVHAPRLAR